jgi:siderophore synthetase component
MAEQDRVLVPEHQQFSILRQVLTEYQDSQAEQPTNQQVDDLQQHPAS